jgi:thiamine biosynthesis protein ThiI
MTYNEILIRYGEIFLKSEPVLRRFEKILRENIKAGLKEEKVKFKISRKRGRIFVKTRQMKKACKILGRIFGIVSFSPCFHLRTSDLKKIQSFVKKNYSKWIRKDQSFAIRARRVGKHDYTSQQLAKALGDIVNRKVDLSDPDVEIFVEVRDNDTYIYREVLDGPGGMPLGSAGKVVCLISGGIDSPVAAWLLMKRGCVIVPLFAFFCRGDESDLKRFKEVVKELKKWHIGKKMRVFIFKHELNLVQFRKKFYKYTCVLCRRMMYRVANELAKRLGAKAIVTGESLAQVASQTLDNLMVIDQASELPVFRPLIGMDKIESVELAKKIGTYEKSCMPVRYGCGKLEGCWARPRKPATKADLNKILKFEKELDVENLLKLSLMSLKEITL